MPTREGSLTELPDPRAHEAASAVRALLSAPLAEGDASSASTVGVVLGSGLGSFADTIADAIQIPYAAVPHLRSPTVAGHSGRLCVGRVGRAHVVCLQGRIHLYEGHDVRDVVLGARLLAVLGCRTVLLTNAAGGIRDGFLPGSFMLLSDHLNLTGRNPLVGVGRPFVDLTHTYDVRIRDLARRAATETGVLLHEGVYAGLLGPSYETPAEVRMLRALGADAVGMSTVVEAIALRHVGVRVGAISCITNLAAGISRQPLDHSEVEATAQRARKSFTDVLTRWVTLAGATV